MMKIEVTDIAYCSPIFIYLKIEHWEVRAYCEVQKENNKQKEVRYTLSLYTDSCQEEIYENKDLVLARLQEHFNKDFSSMIDQIVHQKAIQFEQQVELYAKSLCQS